ncbi:hypothetical protein CJD50_03670 [Hafnia paralvei]|uniref:Uncharacterized protein n=1 Tax=Hafnia paralvei TaxID=546367 RepID=A0A2A2MHY7_9GAMM|nr:hypothetical protein [Hafnia paralvei]PAV98580.1 hypothetical protein CJD50_03670 [Hafnia paralvei]
MKFKLRKTDSESGSEWCWELLDGGMSTILVGNKFDKPYEAVTDLEKKQFAIEKASIVNANGVRIEGDSDEESPIVFVIRNNKPNVWSWCALSTSGETVIDSRDTWCAEFDSCESALQAAKHLRMMIAEAGSIDECNIPINALRHSNKYCERHGLIDTHPMFSDY